jgi:putative ABC transport system permease protein
MVGQLALSIGLVAGAFVMNQQIQYMKTKDLGFDEEQVLTLKTGVNTQEGGAIYDAFRQEAQRLSNVAGVTGALFTPSSGSGNLTGTLRTPGGAEQQVHMNIVDSNYVDMMGIGMVTGRSFPAGASSRNVLVNQALVDALGWTDPVGRTLPTAERGGMGNRIIQDATVAGVVENFHFQPLRKQIQPLVLLPRSVAGGGVSHVAVRLQPGAPSDALDALRQVWSDVAPDLPFDYRFVDDALDAQYRAEERWQSIVGYAAGLALLIAALGLFGLATLAAARRTREIGIRKALGASIASILGLFSRDLAWGVGLALVLATPAAYFALQSWLDTFAYRITLDGTAFALAGGVTLLVALLSIAVQAIRAAQTDPARALRSE